MRGGYAKQWENALSIIGGNVKFKKMLFCLPRRGTANTPMEPTTTVTRIQPGTELKRLLPVAEPAAPHGSRPCRSLTSQESAQRESSKSPSIVQS